MFTEVQVSNSRSHLIYLQIVISKLAAIAGLGRKDTEDIGKAVSEVCSTALGEGSESDECRVIVRLSSEPDCVVADVIDRNALSGERKNVWFDENGYSRGLDSIRRLVDSFELTRGSDELMIRLAKFVSQPGHGNATPQLVGAGTTSLQT